MCQLLFLLFTADSFAIGFSESRIATVLFLKRFSHNHRKLEPQQELHKNPGAASHLPDGLIGICLPINLQFMMLTITLI